jgi:hypothetical protein
LRHLALLDATTIGELGWTDMDDGPLLDLLASAGDVCLTTDGNLEFQQRLDNRSFATVVLFAPTNRLADLLPLVPRVQAALAQLRPGQVVHIAR